MAKVCRTCTNVIIGNDYFYLDGCSYVSTTLQVHQLLQSCIPEFDLELVPDSVMCKNCVSALHIAYYFRQETIKNEEIFRNKQHIRLKNFDDLTRYHRDYVSNNSDDCEDTKVSPCELELEHAHNLKVEFVYEDADTDDANNSDVLENVEMVEVTENVETAEVTENINIEEIAPEATEVAGSSHVVPYDHNFPLLESLECEVDLQVDDETETFEIPEHDDNFDSTTEVIIEENSFDESENLVDESENPVDESENPVDESESTDYTLTDTSNKPKFTKNITAYIQRTSCSSRKIRNVKRPYKCNECNFQTDAKASLIMHGRIHTGEKPFHCTACPYKAKRKAHLDDHMKIHTGERPYRCPMCEKSFITKQIMKKHARIHTGEKPYKCMQCNFQSRHKLSIETHVKRVHIGISKKADYQPSVCYICGKCLAGPASLSTHMRIHTGVKSHLCELCGRYFREKGMLKNHLRTHTGEKPFKCTQCDYIATRKAHLQDHMRTHVGVTELVQCTECGKRYATKLLLKKHMKEEHKTEFKIEQYVE